MARITPALRRLLDEIQEPLTGAWEDVGHGRCARCGDRRRLYRPLAQPSIEACSPCAQVFASVSLYQLSRECEGLEDYEEAGAPPTGASPTASVPRDEDVVEDREPAEEYTLVDGKLIASNTKQRLPH